MEGLVEGTGRHSPGFWKGRRVFITGHTGFKGGWLVLWLASLGARLSGYALPPPTNPAIFDVLNLSNYIESTLADVRDGGKLAKVLLTHEPEIVFHLAAQPLVRASYADPVTTYSTNVMGTANLLEAVRAVDSVRAVVVVTTDKCYENYGLPYAYREADRLGGQDPYSSSKACTELVAHSYRSSFFSTGSADSRQVGIATARAGNVIGGGDWSEDRLLPDAVRAFGRGETLHLRYPSAIRPWQHVLEPLGGYLTLAEKLFHYPNQFSGPWNFGPSQDSVASVQEVVALAGKAWAEASSTQVKWNAAPGSHPHEEAFLLLDSTKSGKELGWSPVLGLSASVRSVIGFEHAFRTGLSIRDYCLKEIDDYQRLAASKAVAGS